MKRLITITLVAFLILPLSAYAEIQTVTQTVQQPFGGSQSPDDARAAGIARAKREALEQFGTYIESTTVVKNAQLDSDDILALTAGVTKAEVVKQKNYTDGDGFGLEITVKVVLDTAILEKSLKRLLEDRNHLKDLKIAREREKGLLARIAELEKENRQHGKTEQQSAKLREEFQVASRGLEAVELLDKAFALWNGKKYSDTKKAIEYYTQAIRLDPNDAQVLSIRGLIYIELEKFDLAIADFDKSIRLDSNYAATYYFRGVAYSKLKQFERSISDLDQAIRLDPNLAAAYHSRGIAYANLGQNDRTISDLTQAIRLDPNNASAYRARGIAYGLSNKAQKGCADLEKACKLGECEFYKLSRKDKLCR